jgi:hypothetical protein
MVIGGLRSAARCDYSIAGGIEAVANGPGAVALGGGYSSASSGDLQFPATIIGAYGSTSTGVTIGGLYNTNSNGGTIIGGRDNTASGSGVTIIGGSYNCNISTEGIILGRNNTACGNYSSILGGFGNQTLGSFSTVVGGTSGRSYLYGQQAFSSGSFAGAGDAQLSQVVTRRRSANVTTGSTLTLSIDGTGVSNLLIPEGTRAWNVTVKWVAVVTVVNGTATGINVGDYMVETNTFGFKRVGGVSSITSVGTSGTFGDASITGSALMTYTAGTSQELKMVFTAPTFAGGGILDMQVVARVELTENSW